MNIRKSTPVLIRVIRSIPVLLIPLFLLLLAGCASRRDVWEDVEVSSGRHEAGSAINSDYLVRRGATLHADFANGSRFYVESGGTFRGLGQGARECTVYAEEGARTERRPGVHYVQVTDASKAYAARGEPVVIPRSPVTVLGGLVAGASLVDNDDDDDDDDDDNRKRRKRSSEISDVRISGSSYKKKQ